MIFLSRQEGLEMERPIKRKEGFREQQLVVLPEYMQKELAETELTRHLYISDIGFFPHAQHHYRERSAGADAHIFIYCINGEGVVAIEKEVELNIQPGNLIVIPAGTPHRYWASEANP